MTPFKTLCLLLPASLLVSSALAKESAIWPMPASLPSLPSGVNPASFPMPRMDWVVRVKSNNDRAAQAADSIKLVFDGDSITDGWQGAGKQVWADHFSKYGAFDFGIGGDRTEHLLWRLSQGQMDKLHPKLIAIMIGTNNMGANSAEQIAEGVKTIVADYRKRCPDSTILVQGIFPRGNKATDPVRAKIKEVNRIIAGLADGDKVVYLDLGEKFLEADGTLSPEIMPDYLHPNTKGYQIWAEALQPVLDKYFPQ